MSTATEPQVDQRAEEFAPELRSAQSATGLVLLLDVIAVGAAFWLALNLRADAPFLPPFTHTFDRYFTMWPVLLLWPVVLWREGLYRGLWIPGSEHLRRLAEGTTVASMIVMTATFVTQAGPQYSRAVVLGGWLLSMPLLAVERLALKALLTQLGFAGPRAALIASPEAAEVVLDSLTKQRPASLRPAAIFNDDPETQGSSVRGVPIVGGVDQAEAWARENDVRTVLVALPGASQDDFLAVLEGPEGPFRRTIVIPDLIGLSSAETTAHDLGGLLALEVKKNLTYPVNRTAKRTLELLLVVGLSPFFVLTAGLAGAAIAIESGRPIFFGQERVGNAGTVFRAWKFRTMVKGARVALEGFLANNPDARAEWQARQKLRKDPRLTGVGRVLRRLSLDELPQMWNVVRGEMALVGPRPIMPEQAELYGPAFNLYKQVRPGLTGLWQVSGRASTTFEQRVELDQYYVRNWSVWLDLVIIGRTFWAVLSGKGAY